MAVPQRRRPGTRRLSSAVLLLAVLSTARCSDGRNQISGIDDSGMNLPVVMIAFIGDQGWEASGEFEGSRAVLQLIKEEGADAVIHQGDFDYRDDPAAWEEMIDEELGPDFPYFVSVGNHDVARWAGAAGYQARMESRMQRLGLAWEDELGAKSTIEYRGIYMTFGAPGTLGQDPTVYADYFEDRLASDKSTWSICSWHKNQRAMQVGGKSSEAGWAVYERCREGGAIIATGHEHSYSRTHLLSNMASQTVASTSDTLVLTAGASFAFVSGLGGRGIRDQELEGDHWAAIYTSDQGANHGALFGVFRFDGRQDLAYFYFKDIDGAIADEFWVISELE